MGSFFGAKTLIMGFLRSNAQTNIELYAETSVSSFSLYQSPFILNGKECKVDGKKRDPFVWIRLVPEGGAKWCSNKNHRMRTISREVNKPLNDYTLDFLVS